MLHDSALYKSIIDIYMDIDTMFRLPGLINTVCYPLRDRQPNFCVFRAVVSRAQFSGTCKHSSFYSLPCMQHDRHLLSVIQAATNAERL